MFTNGSSVPFTAARIYRRPVRPFLCPYYIIGLISEKDVTRFAHIFSMGMAGVKASPMLHALR
jgi:hypothetical protein